MTLKIPLDVQHKYGLALCQSIVQSYKRRPAKDRLDDSPVAHVVAKLSNNEIGILVDVTPQWWDDLVLVDVEVTTHAAYGLRTMLIEMINARLRQADLWVDTDEGVVLPEDLYERLFPGTEVASDG